MNGGRATVLGAGLVGALAAIYLTRRGLSVEVYERRGDPRAVAGPAGRSINLTLCHRGLAALDAVGIGGEVRALAVPALRRRIHGPRGEVADQPYGNRGEAIHSISRNGLNRALIDLAERRFGVVFRFGHDLEGLDLAGGALRLRDAASGRTSELRFERLVAADGANSRVRRKLVEEGRVEQSEVFLDQVYRELPLPPAAGGDWALAPDALHIWPRGRYMLIGFANPDRTFTCALHLPVEGEPSIATIAGERDLIALFERSFPDVLPLLPDLARDYFTASPSRMVTVRCFPWAFDGRVVLLGDAAHAVFPSYGQGANCGFEGCRELDRCLDRHRDDWPRALADYQAGRKRHADAIADLSDRHFHEIRDQVADPRFQLRKRIELRVQEVLGDAWAPLYSLISFTEMPYLDAIELEGRRRPLIDRLMAVDGIERQLDDGCFDRLLLAQPEITEDPEPASAPGRQGGRP